mmetsp:Transcript_27304/g.43930  ORF Transcript_27304/g.43930 Transcript_27304/m.43930 type:complete len:114 (+) Transcript_27304:320-661(+)
MLLKFHSLKIAAPISAFYGHSSRKRWVESEERRIRKIKYICRERTMRNIADDQVELLLLVLPLLLLTLNPRILFGGRPLENKRDTKVHHKKCSYPTSEKIHQKTFLEKRRTSR